MSSKTILVFWHSGVICNLLKGDFTSVFTMLGRRVIGLYDVPI